MSVVALIPAYNEADCITETIEGLKNQIVRPDRIIVIADNCTDDTDLIAKRAGADVFVPINNSHKKAGALNQALEAILPELDDTDHVFIQDADTIIVPAFISTALEYMTRDPRIIISGRYACKPEHGIIGMMQRNEFTRDGRKINRRNCYTHIMVGTSTLFTVRVLRHVSSARASGQLPGHGFVYEYTALTEDFELSIAVKTLGYITMSPPECDAITDVMPTISKLWHQRVRWMRGGLENLHTYGRTDVTKHYIRRQLSILFSITSFFTYIAAVTSTLLIVGHIDFALAWIPLTVLFIIDRAVVVKKAGPLAIFVSMLMIPEIIYDIFQQIIYLVATIKAIRGTEAEWKET